MLTYIPEMLANYIKMSKKMLGENTKFLFNPSNCVIQYVLIQISVSAKYQQIVKDHIETSNTVALEKNGLESQEKKVPNLVGYNSDSDADESTSETDIDPKVHIVLKVQYY